MIADRSRYADAARRTFGLEPRRHIHNVTVEISAIGYRVAKVDPDAETHGAVRWMVAVMYRNLLLNPYGTAHRAINAIEHDE